MKTGLIVNPFLIGQPLLAPHIRISRLQPLQERSQQHWHRQERAGDFQQAQPFGVVAGRWTFVRD